MPADGELIRQRRRSLTSVIPVLAWLPRYDWARSLPADVVAGVAVAALLIPESMGYAGVAGVPAEVGLYAALAAVFAYAVTGGTSILVVGPASAVAALSASIVSEFSGDANPIALTAALAITSGALLVAAGALRLGWIVNFISHPVLEAFVAGLSISIIIGQLDGLVGVEVEGETAVAKLIDLVREVDAWDAITTVIGVGAVVAILLLERIVPRVPAAIVVVVVGIVLVAAFDLADQGVAIVGDIPQGLPEFGVPDLSGSRWLELLAGGMTLVLVGFSEGYASASAVADHTGEEVDADQELLASGAANLASGAFGGLAVGGSLSKSAAAQGAGAKSQMANVTAGLVVLATLLFLAPLFEELPEPVLAAIVIVAVLGSADPRRLVPLWRVNRLDFAAGIATFTLVLVWEALPAMIVGIVLSLAFIVRRASFPDVVELRRSGPNAYRRVDGPDEELAPTPGVVVLRHEAPLVYANAARFRAAALELVSRQADVRRLVVDAEMWSDVDSSGAEILEKLDAELAARDIEVRIARVHQRARRQLDRSELMERFAGRVHLTLEEAVTGAGPVER